MIVVPLRPHAVSTNEVGYVDYSGGGGDDSSMFSDAEDLFAAHPLEHVSFPASDDLGGSRAPPQSCGRAAACVGSTPSCHMYDIPEGKSAPAGPMGAPLPKKRLRYMEATPTGNFDSMTRCFDERQGGWCLNEHRQQVCVLVCAL
jgi:hypothetical protein